MDARPFLAEIAGTLQRLRFDVVLIGNAAAALQGAPVTTVDFDFLFRKTPTNLRKLKALATSLGATVLRPYYPASDLYRVVRDDDGLQLDFMVTIHGLRSFAAVRARAETVDIDGCASACCVARRYHQEQEGRGRPRDLAVLDVLEKTHEEAEGAKGKIGRPQA